MLQNLVQQDAVKLGVLKRKSLGGGRHEAHAVDAPPPDPGLLDSGRLDIAPDYACGSAVSQLDRIAAVGTTAIQPCATGNAQGDDFPDAMLGDAATPRRIAANELRQRHRLIIA